MGIRIASFNMHNFSLERKDLDRIAKIILDNKIDIVAMQEVLAEGRAISGITLDKDESAKKSAFEKSLLIRLGSHWDTYWADPQTKSKFYPYLGNDKRGEGYAFLWNVKKLELLRDKNNRLIYPTIFRNYKTDYGEGAWRLIRDPLYGRFKLKESKNELRLITTHIVFGKPNAGNAKDGYDFDKGAIALRRHEFGVLAGSIYSRIRDYRKDINTTVPYTIILGDYNLNLRSSGATHAFVDEIAFFDSLGRETVPLASDAKPIYTVQGEMTTLGKDQYSNNYDHFSFDDTVKGVVVGVGRIDAVHSHENPDDQTEAEKFARFNKDVSDHVPIILDIAFRK